MQGLVERIGSELTLSAYLETGLDDVARAELAQRARGIEGVMAVEALSAADALERFPERTGVSAEAIEVLDANPLPASLEVRLATDSRGPEQVARVRSALLALGSVTDVSGGEDWVAGYGRALGFVRALGLGVGSVLGLTILVIVASTVRLALLARRDELEILSLVGASRATLQLPFLLEGTAQGALAGLLALALLRGLFVLAKPSVDAALGFLAGPDAAGFLGLGQMTALVGGGALLGLVGAAISLLGERRA